MRERQRDVVEAQGQTRARIVLKREARPHARRLDGPALHVDGDLGARVALYQTHQLGDRICLDLDRYDPALQAVRAEDLRKTRRYHRTEAELVECPDRVLARGSAAEVRAGDENARARVARIVEHERGIASPRLEESRAVAGPLDALQPMRGDDLVGVDIRAVERHRAACHAAYGPHDRSSGSAKCPAIAVAAATAGETRCVRPPGP